MNEQIRKLAENAGFIGESINPVFGTTQEIALENFAKLLVTKCAIIATRCQQRNEKHAGAEILDYFGVEE